MQPYTRQPLSIYVRSAGKAATRFYHKVELRLLRFSGSFWKASENEAPEKDSRPLIDSATLKGAFDALGLRSGDTVLVHSGLSKLGKITGGPRGVFDAIKETVGIQGNMLFPVFPFGSLMYCYLRSNPVFDVKNSPSKMGALTEYALRAPGGQRSIHPTHSVMAFGESREYLTGEHHVCPTPFADKSPFARLVEASGKILLIGVGLNSTTSFHRIEDRLGEEFPVRVYRDEVFTVRCIDMDDKEHHVTTLSHDPYISRVRDCNLVRDSFLQMGVMKEAAVGNGTISLIDAKAMDDCLERLYRASGLTIYGKIWG